MLAELAVQEAARVVTVVELMDAVEGVGRLVTAVIVIVVLVGIALVVAHRRLAKNQVELAELVRDRSPKGGEGPTGLA
jgi:hypothetical protein